MDFFDIVNDKISKLGYKHVGDKLHLDWYNDVDNKTLTVIKHDSNVMLNGDVLQGGNFSFCFVSLYDGTPKKNLKNESVVETNTNNILEKIDSLLGII